MDDLWSRSTVISVTEPPIPRTQLIAITDLPDHDEAAKRIANFAYDQANLGLAIDLSRGPGRKIEAEAARRLYQKLLDEMANVDPVRTVVTSKELAPVGVGRKVIGGVLYAAAGFVMVSISWMAAQWVIDADLFDAVGHSFVMALLTTGIVLSAGVAAPLVVYSLFGTDQEKKRFTARGAKLAFVLGVCWLVLFALVEGLDGFNSYLVGHPFTGVLRPLGGLLSAAEALAKFVMLPAQISGECAAAVAVEIAASRFRLSNRETINVLNPYHANLAERVAAAHRAADALAAEVTRLETLSGLLTLGREVFAAKCAAAIHAFHAEQQAAASAVRREHIKKQTQNKGI